jgi:N-methylhydantoinase A
VAEPLGLTPLEGAAAIYEIVTANMAGAVRMMTIERGLDPREFVLVSFGGSGPVHVAEIARTFGIATVVVPAHAGVRSAVGLLGTDLATDQVQSCLTASGDHDVERIVATFEELEARAAAELGLDFAPGLVVSGAAHEGLRCLRMADVRYQGQAHQVVVAVPPGPLDDQVLERIAGAFFEQYKEIYGVGDPAPTEIVNCRLRLERVVPKWTGRRARTRRAVPASPVGRRPAWFAETASQLPSPVYDWPALAPGQTFDGPALVDGPDATVVVPPSWSGSVDGGGNIVLVARP